MKLHEIEVRMYELDPETLKPIRVVPNPIKQTVVITDKTPEELQNMLMQYCQLDTMNRKDK